MKDGRIRFGLIGYGKVAQLHAKALTASEHCQLVSVCGRNESNRRKFADTWGIQARATVAEMASLDGVEAVIITTPHPAHRQGAVEAFAAGCHVLVEKPMALTVRECEEMLQASRETGRKLGVVSQRRWYPSCQRIKQALLDGKLGEPAIGQIIMLGWRDLAYYQSDPWRGRWDTEGGGVLINQAPHQIDLLHWYMGPVEEVSAYWLNVNHPYIEVEDTAVAALRFKKGGLGSILVSNSQKPGIYAKVHVHGTSAASVGVQTDGGAMFVAGMSNIVEPPYNDLWTIPEEIQLLEKWKKEDEEFFSTIDATWYFFRLQADDFALSIQKDRIPAVTGEDGLETVKIIEGIYRSGTEHCPIRY